MRFADFGFVPILVIQQAFGFYRKKQTTYCITFFEILRDLSSELSSLMKVLLGSKPPLGSKASLVRFTFVSFARTVSSLMKVLLGSKPPLVRLVSMLGSKASLVRFAFVSFARTGNVKFCNTWPA